MLRIAIVEDEPACAQQLQEYIDRYQAERGLEISVSRFSDGIELVEQYTPAWDILFLDIQMKLLDGMETARRIRAQDPYVTIVFITNLARYAIQGYEVDASDFILKPLEYDRFRVRMDKVTASRSRNREASVSSSLRRKTDISRQMQTISKGSLLYWFHKPQARRQTVTQEGIWNERRKNLHRKDHPADAAYRGLSAADRGAPCGDRRRQHHGSGLCPDAGQYCKRV